MSSDLLSRNTILDVATPFSDDAVRSFDTDRHTKALLEQKQQDRLAANIEKRSELLATPEKIDAMVAGSLEDIYPLASKPKKTSMVQTDNIDDSLKQADHPFAGIGGSLKDSFKQALQRRDLLNAAPHEVLAAVKQDLMNQKGEDGKTLLERAHQYKMEKDDGGLFAFHPSKFIPGMESYSDKNVKALPGYEQYKQQNEKMSTSAPEAFAMGAAGALVGAGITAVTGGAAAPVASILGRMAVAGAVAIPEFKVFDAAANAVNSTYGQSEDASPLGKLGAELAMGVLATAVTHKVSKFGIDKALTAAIDAGKVSESSVAMLKKTGMATDAIAAFEARANEAKELTKAQEAIKAAEAQSIKEATKAEQREKVIAASTGEAGLGLEDFLKISHADRNPLVRPAHAEVMGLDAATLKQAQSNPVVLFNLIENEDIANSVIENIGKGMSSQKAVLKGFQDEAALRLLNSGIEDTGIDFNKLMTGSSSSEVSKAGYSKTVKTPGEINLENSVELAVNKKDIFGAEMNVPNTMDRLLSGVPEPTVPKGAIAKQSEFGGTVHVPKVEVTVQKDIFGTELGKEFAGNGPAKIEGGVAQVLPEVRRTGMFGEELGKPVTAQTGPAMLKPEELSSQTAAKVKKDMFGQHVTVVDNFTTSVVQPVKYTGPAAKEAKVVSTSVNTVGLAAAGLLAGGMALFGTDDKAEAGVIGEVGKVAGEVGKKLLDGGIHIKPTSLEVAAEKVSSPNTKAILQGVAAKGRDGASQDISVRLGMHLRDLAESGIKSGKDTALWERVSKQLEDHTITPSDAKEIFNSGAREYLSVRTANELKIVAETAAEPIATADVVTKLMQIHQYRDVPAVLKTMEEMGIDTEHRIGYHGTPVAESTLKGHAEEFTRAGLYNDEGEFAKYFSHDPNVSAGYSGVEPARKFVSIEAKDAFVTDLKAAMREAGYDKEAIRNVNYMTGADPNFIRGAEKLGLDTDKYLTSTQPNIQKSLLVTKKTYPMEGAIPEDVAEKLKEFAPYLPDRPIRNAHDAWKALGEASAGQKVAWANKEVDQMLKEITQHEDFDGYADGTMHLFDKMELISEYTDLLSDQSKARTSVLFSAFTEQHESKKRFANDILRSLGYDSITHLGQGDGFVTIALKNGVEKPFFSGADLADKVLKSVAVMAVSMPLLQLLSPDQAEASVGSLAGKVASEPVVKTLMEEAGGKLEGVFGALFKRQLVSETVSPGTTTLPQMQRQFEQAPKIGRSVEAVNQVVGKFKSHADGLAQFVSPYTFDKVYGKVGKSISVQLASMQNAMTNNTNNALIVAQSIIDGVKGIKPEHTKEIAEFMKPVQEAYDNVAIPLRAAEIESEAANKVIENVKAALKDGKYSEADAAALIKEQQTKLDGLKKLFAEYQPKFAEVDGQYQAAKQELLQKYPSARISFALDEPGLLDGPMKDLFSTEEKVAVAQFQQFYGSFKVRAKEAGLDVIEGAYNKHSRDNTAVNAEMEKLLDSYGIQIGRNIPLTDFFSRSKYSKQMIPDIQRNVFEYTPDAERRIQGADFWRKGRQDGWYAFSQNELIKSNKVWSEYFDRIAKGMVPPPQTTMNKLAQRYASVETLRLLAFLPSAPFKHLFKNTGTWATLGFTHSMQQLPEAVTTSFRNTVNEALKAKGMTDKMLPKGALDDFVNSMVKQRSMVNPLSDLERPDVITSKVDMWLDKLNNAGGIGIRAVEAFDRTHTVQAALDMSLKKGMTAEQAMYSIYDTILKNNFLGGSLNPEWMHNPKIRALALFQNTPFKIMERRLVAARALGKDAHTAWGVIKSQKVEETLAQLMDLKYFIKSGENELKKNMIYDALTGTKDAFGNSVSAQFMKEFLITGAVLAGGQAVNADFERHSVHIPFFKSGTKEPVLSTSPIVDATWKTLAGEPSSGHPGAGVEFVPTTDDDKEFFAARFFRHWTSSTGGAQPLVLHKMKRISEEDIPEIYKDSIFRYLFAVPTHSTH